MNAAVSHIATYHGQYVQIAGRSASSAGFVLSFSALRHRDLLHRRRCCFFHREKIAVLAFLRVDGTPERTAIRFGGGRDRHIGLRTGLRLLRRATSEQEDTEKHNHGDRCSFIELRANVVNKCRAANFANMKATQRPQSDSNVSSLSLTIPGLSAAIVPPMHSNQAFWPSYT